MMQSLSRQTQYGFSALVLSLLLGALPARGQSPAPDLRPQCYQPSPGAGETFCYAGNLYLRNTSSEISRKVCLGDDPSTCAPALIQKLGAMKPEDRCDALATKALLLRQEISEMVLTTSLQVDGFLAEVDNETDKIRAVRDRLANRRDSAVGHSALGSAVGTGGGAVGSALALGAETAARVGSWVGAVSGGIGAVFGFWGYFQASGPTGCFPNIPGADCLNLKQPVEVVNLPKDSCTGAGCSPSMLSYLLLRKDPGFHSEYDPVIRTYLETQRSQLLQQWELEESQIDELITRNTSARKLSGDERKIDALLARNTSPRKLSIDDLTDRANKLADVRAVVSRINRDLSRLTDDLGKGLRCSSLP
jgi:hypothetical protein